MKRKFIIALGVIALAITSLIASSCSQPAKKSDDGVCQVNTSECV